MEIAQLVFTILVFLWLMGIWGVLDDIRKILKGKEFTVYNMTEAKDKK